MDPQQFHQYQGLMAGMGVAIVVIWLLMWAFFIFLFWRVFTKAGMSGALALIALLPGLGWIICMCILAFSQWRVAPVGTMYGSGYGSGQPGYPPPAYPPVNYPPAGPPTQL